MQFPNSGTGRPYIRLDARTATFKASCVDCDPVEVDLIGKIVDLDLANAEQGWIKVGQQGADCRNVESRRSTDRPGQEKHGWRWTWQHILQRTKLGISTARKAGQSSTSHLKALEVFVTVLCHF